MNHIDREHWLRCVVPKLLLSLFLGGISCAGPTTGSFAPPSDMPAPPPAYWDEVRAVGDTGCCVNMLQFEASCIYIDNLNDAVRDDMTPIKPPKETRDTSYIWPDGVPRRRDWR